MKNIEGILKNFGMSNIFAEIDLDRVEKKFDINLGRPIESKKDDVGTRYYPQFDSNVRREAETMSGHYEIFYCLETSIRSLINDRLREEFGVDWWLTKAPEEVQKNVTKNIKKEADSAVSLRSENQIDYTTFGELGEIIKFNWEIFGDTFNSKRGVERVMGTLNTLRAPIAHCCPLAEDEVDRLKLAVKDWFRIMG